MLRRIADILVQRRVAVLVAWGVAAVVLAGSAAEPPSGDARRTPMLPPDAASREATEALGAYFPLAAGLSQAVVTVERADDPATAKVESLTRADLAALRSISRRITDPEAGPYARRIDVGRLGVLSPVQTSALRPAMISKPRRGLGQAALVTVQIPADRISLWAVDVAKHVEYIVETTKTPQGLSKAVTGTAAFEHDYAEAARRSQRQTLPVAVAAVVGILLIAYRAPVLAAIALAAVAMAAAAAAGGMTAAAMIWIHVGAVERLFLYVLLFGATVNYSLFYLAGYRERLSMGRPPTAAAVDSWLATAPVIAASAAITIAGLCTLAVARYGLFRSLGPTAAAALAVAAAAALTLVPALAATLGTRLFWPGKRRGPYTHHGPIWPAIASFVTNRPKTTLALALILLGAPALQAGRMTWSYDVLADLKPTYSAMRGAAVIGRHWTEGELAPVGVLIEAPEDVDAETFVKLSNKLTARLAKSADLSDVRSATAPIGTRTDRRFAPAKPFGLADIGRILTGPADGVARRITSIVARDSYIHRRAMRMEVVMTHDAFSPAATAAIVSLRRRIEAEMAGTPLAGSRVHLAGITPEMMDIRSVTRNDFRRVAAAALAVIAVVVLILVGDVVLAIFMVGGTVLGYLAALGTTSWVFAALGADGIDWKVELFLFVVMVAVGTDYSVFLMTRLAVEGRTRSPAKAARRAIEATGGIISACGLIMAATLGAMTAGDLGVLVQLGFALAVGMVIDTFIIRPLLIPSLAVLTGRTGRAIS